MSARSSRFSGFGSRRRRGKAAGAVIACAVMLLAGCGGSGGSSADAGAPIIRGAAPFIISNTPTTFAVDTIINVTTSGGTTGRFKEVTTTGVCAKEGISFSTAVKATVPGECIVTVTQEATTDGDAMEGLTQKPTKERATATFTFTAAPALTADAPALTVSGTPTNPIAGETVTLTTAGGSGSGDVSYTVQPSVCKVTNSVLTRPQQGTCVVTATQGGSTGTAFFVFASGTSIFFVKFNANGGSGSIANQEASTATALTANNGAIQRTGYTFDGWARLPTEAQAYADGATYPFTASAMLFARWVAVTPVHTVTFDPNNGVGSIASQSATGATLLTSNANAIKRSGYAFNGWNTSANGSGTAYPDGASYPFAASATLYATWGCLPLTAPVTVSAKRVGANKAEVYFTAPSSESPWKSFAAKAAKEGGKGATLPTDLNTGTITVNGLDKNSGYTLDVTATNEAGCSYKATANRITKW